VHRVIVRGFTARLYPTAEQARRLNRWAGALVRQRRCCTLWNRLLEREQAEYAASGKFLWKRELQPLAIAMKKASGTKWLADLPAHAVLDTVSRLDGALRKMVKDRKAGRRCGFPRPKKKFVNEAGIYCVGQATALSARTVRVPKLGEIKLRGGKSPAGRLLSARIWRDGARWMLSAQIESERPEPLPAAGISFGLDLGVSTLVTAFDGEGFLEVEAPRHLRKSLKRLRRAQRALSRRRKGSHRRRAQARKVAVIHRKVRERRKDILHQITHRLTAKADAVRVESLNVRGMLRNRRLAMSVADAGMSCFVSFLAYKADWRGRTVERIDPWTAALSSPSSQACSCCGAINPAMRDLKRRVLVCPDCGHVEGRDRNAARNVFWYGQEGRNRASNGATGGEIGVHDGACSARVPVGEPPMFASSAVC
jgi:putative transposase